MKLLHSSIAAGFMLFTFAFHANAYPHRMDWWMEARYGMFIHWDMSSVAGTEISWSRKGSRPLDITGQPAGYVEDVVYDNLYKQFNPEKFNAKEWVKLAKDAGMKYMVFTAKHHGGFCMWDTKLTDYSIMHTPFKRDVVKELADACQEAGLRFGIYYSQRDWHHPDYGMGDNRKYVDYMNGQVKELLSNYGKIDIIWWDSYGRGDLVNFWRIGETYDLATQLQPDIIMNNRLAVLGSYNAQPAAYRGDMDTPEQRLGVFQNTRPWESCMCVVDAPGGGWSFRTNGKVKSYERCMKILLGCATGDGNLLLDIGPDSHGTIPDDQAALLLKMGSWLKSYGQSIYGTRGGPFHNGRWGGSTYKDDIIYLHVAEWNSERLELPALKAKVLKATCLTAPNTVPKIEQTPTSTIVTLPMDKQDSVDTIIVLQLSAKAADEMSGGQPLKSADRQTAITVQQAADGTLILPAHSASIVGSKARIQMSGGIKNIGNWTNPKDSVKWNVIVTQGGRFKVTLTYSCAPESAGGKITLNIGPATLEANVGATSGWNDFRTVELGTMEIVQPGQFSCTVQPAGRHSGGIMNLVSVQLAPQM